MRIISEVCLNIAPFNIYRWALKKKKKNQYKEVSSIQSLLQHPS